jgi:hypothetical protein
MDFRIGYRRPLRTATLLRKKRLRNRLCLGVMAAVAVAVTACSWEPGAGPSAPAGKTAAAPTLKVALQTTAAAPAPAARRIYPHSIVPGGVDSRADIAQRVAADPVVARHYASFQIGQAHAVKVNKPRAVYVSYRKGDKVYWTAKKMMLAQGETLLTDGTSDIRGRCGNRISDTPMLPVAMNEPTEAEFDRSMNVDDGSLQNASFALDEPLAGNPTAFQRFASFALSTDVPPAAQVERPGMPSVPSGDRNGMGLMPTSYLSVSSGPAMALGPAVSVTPPAAAAPPATADVPATPATPSADPVPPVATVPPIVTVPPVVSVPPVAIVPPIVTVPPVVGVPPVAIVPPIVTVPPVVGVPPVATVPPVVTVLPHGEIPEPGTLWLVGFAFALLVVMTRKKRAA